MYKWYRKYIKKRIGDGCSILKYEELTHLHTYIVISRKGHERIAATSLSTLSVSSSVGGKNNPLKYNKRSRKTTDSRSISVKWRWSDVTLITLECYYFFVFFHWSTLFLSSSFFNLVFICKFTFVFEFDKKFNRLQYNIVEVESYGSTLDMKKYNT